MNIVNNIVVFKSEFISSITVLIEISPALRKIQIPTRQNKVHEAMNKHYNPTLKKPQETKNLQNQLRKYSAKQTSYLFPCIPVSS